MTLIAIIVLSGRAAVAESGRKTSTFKLTKINNTAAKRKLMKSITTLYLGVSPNSEQFDRNLLRKSAVAGG
jgi:hypothetical protein